MLTAWCRCRGRARGRREGREYGTLPGSLPPYKFLPPACVSRVPGRLLLRYRRRPPVPRALSPHHLLHPGQVDAGGDMIVTQLFYDVDVFLQFVKDCRWVRVRVCLTGDEIHRARTDSATGLG